MRDGLISPQGPTSNSESQQHVCEKLVVIIKPSSVLNSVSATLGLGRHDSLSKQCGRKMRRHACAAWPTPTVGTLRRTPLLWTLTMLRMQLHMGPQCLGIYSANHDLYFYSFIYLPAYSLIYPGIWRVHYLTTICDVGSISIETT